MHLEVAVDEVDTDMDPVCLVILPHLTWYAYICTEHIADESFHFV